MFAYTGNEATSIPGTISESFSSIMSKLQIETLKSVHSSCCFTILDIFWTNLFRPTKFRTSLLLYHFRLGKITNWPVLIWSGPRRFTVVLVKSRWAYIRYLHAPLELGHFKGVVIVGSYNRYLFIERMKGRWPGVENFFSAKCLKISR